MNTDKKIELNLDETQSNIKLILFEQSLIKFDNIN